MNSDGRSKTWEDSDVNIEEDTPSDPMTRSLWGKNSCTTLEPEYQRRVTLAPKRLLQAQPLPVTCVDEGVFLHVGLLVESLATVLTGVGSGVGVNEQVCGQRGRPLEALATDLTVKASFLQRGRKGEGEMHRSSLGCRPQYQGQIYPRQSPLLSTSSEPESTSPFLR